MGLISIPTQTGNRDHASSGDIGGKGKQAVCVEAQGADDVVGSHDVAWLTASRRRHTWLCLSQRTETPSGSLNQPRIPLHDGHPTPLPF